jgi:membrane-bound lytic murein transglycosylase D
MMLNSVLFMKEQCGEKPVYLKGAKLVRRFNRTTIHCILAIILTSVSLAQAQEDVITFDDFLQTGQQWVQENIDPNIVRSLNDPNQQNMLQLLNNLQQQLQGEDVVDLASLKDAATTVLPLLKMYDETRPYAAWLETRLDYFELADQFKHTFTPPRVEPNQPPRPIPNPQPEVERKAWQKQIEKRPLLRGSESYVNRLKPIFATQGVPKELVWLAEVESSFDPLVRSPAGTAGLFQLMPRTAKSYGLSLRPVDERLQPEKNAAAAARYLKYLHGEFKDWPLTLAAYNAGEGRVQNLLSQYKTQSFDKIATHLPAETQMYVPKINATLLRREGVTLAQLP